MVPWRARLGWEGTPPPIVLFPDGSRGPEPVAAAKYERKYGKMYRRPAYHPAVTPGQANANANEESDHPDAVRFRALRDGDSDDELEILQKHNDAQRRKRPGPPGGPPGGPRRF